MKYYSILLQKGCVDYNNIAEMTGSRSATNSLINYYCKKNKMVKIRKGMYAMLSPFDESIIPNRFVIGSKISDSSVISHSSAFEYYGLTNQVSYQVCVSSISKFNDFYFDGYDYKYIPTKYLFGIDEKPGGIKVTDLERTVIESIGDFESIMGFEELISCIELIPLLDESTLIRYLDIIGKKYLFQKVGFVLEHFKRELRLSDDFFNYCMSSYGSSSRYFLSKTNIQQGAYSKKWRLTYPESIWGQLEKGEERNDI